MATLTEKVTDMMNRNRGPVSVGTTGRPVGLDYNGGTPAIERDSAERDDAIMEWGVAAGIAYALVLLDTPDKPDDQLVAEAREAAEGAVRGRPPYGGKPLGGES